MRMPVQRFNFIDTARDNLVAKFKGASLAFARRSCLAACCVAVRVCARVLGLLSTADARRHWTAGAVTAGQRPNATSAAVPRAFVLTPAEATHTDSFAPRGAWPR